MIAWLYRYVFRGIRVLMLIGIVTLLVLAMSRHISCRPAKTPDGPAVARPVSA